MDRSVVGEQAVPQVGSGAVATPVEEAVEHTAAAYRALGK